MRNDGDEISLLLLGLLQPLQGGSFAIEQQRVLDRCGDGRNEHQDARTRVRWERVELRRIDLQNPDRLTVHDQRHAEVAPHVRADAFPSGRRRDARVGKDVGDVDRLGGRGDGSGDAFPHGDTDALRFVGHRRLGCDGDERAVVDQLDRAAAERDQPAERAEARLEDLLQVEGARYRSAELQQQACLIERRRTLDALSGLFRKLSHRRG